MFLFCDKIDNNFSILRTKYVYRMVYIYIYIKNEMGLMAYGNELKFSLSLQPI